jgi:predicted DNA-binding protein
MIAVKINDPAMEKVLAEIAKQQNTSRQAIVRAMIAKQLEDRADYQAAVEATRNIASGKSKILSSDEMWGRLGLAD